jgi:hypothetical protein
MEEQSIVTLQFTTTGSLTCCASLEPDPDVLVCVLELPELLSDEPVAAEFPALIELPAADLFSAVESF